MLCGLLITSGLYAQTHSEKITRTFAFEKSSDMNAVIVSNVNGSVRIEGYDGNEVKVEVDKQISAKTQERLDQGRKQIQLGVIDRADTLVFFVEGSGMSFGPRRDNNKWDRGAYGYDWCCGNCNNGCDCRVNFDYTMNFVVRVPRNVHAAASTVNNGNIAVSGLKGAVHANNVNGSIKLTDLVREASASTVNGDVDIEYTTNPRTDCRFYSLNGDINAYFQKGLAASMSFESFNGDFFTNVDRIEALPVAVEKHADTKGVKYKINGTRYRIGNGGNAMLDFETFNGNVYLKERAN